MKRFKTKQEFGPDGPSHWNEQMDAYFGLPWNATGNQHPFPELEEDYWNILPEHLINHNHPYQNKEYCVKVNTQDQSRRVQKKAFYLGYSWSGSTEVKHIKKPYLYFDDVSKLITFGSGSGDLVDDLEYMILGYQGFMEAAALTSVSHFRKSKRSESRRHRDGEYVVFDLGTMKLKYQIRSNGELWFLNREGGTNSEIFKRLGLRKELFIQSIVGYHPDDGEFPYVRTLPEISRVITELQIHCKRVRDQCSPRVQLDVSQLSGTSHTTFDLTDALSQLKKIETKAAGAASYKQSKTTQNGRCIKVQRQTPAVRSGERPDGRRISGRTGKATIRRRSLGHETITSRI